jgi:tetratricopeptide (TPR) repeat protein
MINGLIVPAVDNRLNTIILIACGIYPESKTSMPEVNPINFVSHYNSPTYFLYGKYDEAIEACDQAIKIDPDLAKGWIWKGLILSESGKNKEAIEAYDQLIKMTTYVTSDHMHNS